MTRWSDKMVWQTHFMLRFPEQQLPMGSPIFWSGWRNKKKMAASLGFQISRHSLHWFSLWILLRSGFISSIASEQYLCIVFSSKPIFSRVELNQANKGVSYRYKWSFCLQNCEKPIQYDMIHYSVQGTNRHQRSYNILWWQLDLVEGIRGSPHDNQRKPSKWPWFSIDFTMVLLVLLYFLNDILWIC